RGRLYSSYMTIEFALLAASVVLGIVHIIVVSHLQSWQRGYRWTASSREQSGVPLTGFAGRFERALRNYLETFPFFAAAILLVRQLQAKRGGKRLDGAEQAGASGYARLTKNCHSRYLRRDLLDKLTVPAILTTALIAASSAAVAQNTNYQGTTSKPGAS